MIWFFNLNVGIQSIIGGPVKDRLVIWEIDKISGNII